MATIPCFRPRACPDHTAYKPKQSHLARRVQASGILRTVRGPALPAYPCGDLLNLRNKVFDLHQAVTLLPASQAKFIMFSITEGVVNLEHDTQAYADEG